VVDRRRDSCSDAELVAAARAGDKDALAVLVGRHQPMVLALSRRLLGEATLAADALQEATLAALTGLERLHSPDRFGAWYAGIALNLGRRWLRATDGSSHLLDELPDARPGPEEMAEAADMARRVRQAVEVLAPGQREAVLAFYWQGLTHAEAAAELGTSAGAVKARLHQARAALAPKLASCRPFEEEVLTMTSSAEADWVEVEVTEVRRAEGDETTRRVHAVVLTERMGARCLPIYTGAAEAVALACTLEAVETPRPMTFQLAAGLVSAAGSQVEEVRITRLAESTFYAVVVIEGPAGRAEVDARPSDALNLALVCGAPIRVDAALLDDPEVTGRTAWEQFTTRESELVAEVEESRQELLASLAEHEPDKPGC
jgi:RNA polymerase sigma factor (sigma-70 family)